MRFLSQFNGPFDLKDALNCPADFEMGDPETWHDSKDYRGIFWELHYAAFIEVRVVESVSVVDATQVENTSASSYQYLLEVTDKGRVALVKEPLANRLIKWLSQPSTSNYSSEVPTLARVSSN